MTLFKIAILLAGYFCLAKVAAAAVAQLAIDAAMDWLNELALRWLDDPFAEWADGEGREAMERLPSTSRSLPEDDWGRR